VVNLLGGYEWVLNDKVQLTFDLRTVFAGGNPVLPVNGTVYDWSNAYGERVDDYFRMDFKAGIRLNGKKIRQEWAFDIQNVTNNQNVFQQYWDPTEQKIATDYQQAFFPMVFYRIYF